MGMVVHSGEATWAKGRPGPERKPPKQPIRASKLSRYIFEIFFISIYNYLEFFK